MHLCLSLFNKLQKRCKSIQLTAETHPIFEMPTQRTFIISKLDLKNITYIIYSSSRIKSIWSLLFP